MGSEVGPRKEHIIKKSAARALKVSEWEKTNPLK
jgi:hypothetical protein